jgi:hypothetical protein
MIDGQDHGQPGAEPVEPMLADEIVADLARLRAVRDAAGAERDRCEAERGAMRRQAAAMFERGELSPAEVSRVLSTDFRLDEGATDNAWSDHE